MSVYSNHHPEAISGVPPDPYDVAEPADREDWPESDPRWDERWGLCFADDVPPDEAVSRDTPSSTPLLDLRDFVVTKADLRALSEGCGQLSIPFVSPLRDADVLLVPQEGGA
jgi:hypothetical protein